MKLRNKYLIIMISAIIIPALVIGVIGTMSLKGYYTQGEQNVAVYGALTAGMSTRDFFNGQKAELAVLSRLDLVRRASVGDYTNSDKTEMASLIAQQTSDPYILDLIVMDAGGMVISGSNEADIQKTFFDYGDPLLAAPTDGIYVSPLYYAESGKYSETVFTVTKPIITDGAPTGYISRVISANALTGLLSSCSFGSGGKVVLIDQSGNVMNYNAGVINRKEEINAADLNAVLNSTGNEQNGYSRLDAGGSYGAYGAIEGTDWKWAGLSPSSIISENTSGSILMGLLLLVGFAALDAVILILVYKRITAPMNKILAAVKQIREGDKECRLPVDDSHEFSNISNLFNDLMDNAAISEEIHRTISDLSDNMLFEWNLDEGRLYASDNFRNAFALNYERTNLLDGTFLDKLMEAKDGAKFRRDLSAVLNGTRDSMENDYQIKTASGEIVWYNLRAKAIQTRSGEITRVIGVLTDINVEKKQSLSLSQRASYDFLSQLYNRSTFIRELERKLDLRRSDEHYAILFIDVDDFKFINDRYGHNVGDEVIRFVSDTAKNKLGENGFAGRFGGDEFVLCVTTPSIVEHIDEFSMEMIDMLYQGYHCVSGELDVVLNINVSIGISLIPEHGTDATELVGNADEAMYFVKKNGKANYHVYDPADSSDPDELDNTLV